MSYKVILFLIPLILALGIMGICYPGFMSYDSIRMLEEARSFVRGGSYPPAPVYILRFFDLTGFGVPVMVLTQNLIVLVSMTILLHILGAGMVGTVVSLLVLLSMPTVIGCMLVLWKDVTMISLLMLSLVLILLEKTKNGHEYSVVKWSSLVLIFLATLVRFNAITATLIIIIYWIMAFYGHSTLRKKVIGFTCLSVLLIVFNSGINNHRVPSFEKLEPNNLFYAVMSYDLLGISKWSRIPLVPFASEQSSVQVKTELHDIDAIYSPLGAEVMKVNNRNTAGNVRIYPEKYSPKDLTKAWTSAILLHPASYFRYRWDLFSEIIGATDHATYEPTHFNRIDENKFGIVFHDRAITRMALGYIGLTSSVILGKPWLFMAIGLLTVLLTWKSQNISHEYKIFSYVSFGAAMMYVLPFFFVTATGEVRYSMPSIVLCFNCVLVWFFARGKGACFAGSVVL